LHLSCLKGKKKRLILVGCGHLGKWHLDKMLNNKDVDVVGVVEALKSRRETLKNDYPQVLFYEELRDIALERFDGVVIAAHTSAHYEIISYFLDKEKRIFCEKPVVQSLEEYEQLSRCPKEQLQQHLTGHIERFRPEWSDPEVSMALAQAQTLNFERYAEFKDRSLEISVIDDVMIHDLDLLISLWGEPLRIEAFGQKTVGHSWDQVIAHFYYSKGRLATLRGVRNYPYEVRKISGFGPEVQFENNMLERKFQFKKNAHPAEAATVKSFSAFDGLAVELNHFVQVMDGETPVKVSFVDGLLALKWAKEIEKQLSTQPSK
jgi:predicted dehydrogenase